MDFEGIKVGAVGRVVPHVDTTNMLKKLSLYVRRGLSRHVARLAHWIRAKHPERTHPLEGIGAGVYQSMLSARRPAPFKCASAFKRSASTQQEPGRD